MVLALDLNGSQSQPDKQSSLTLSPLASYKNYQGSLQPRNFPSLPTGWLSEREKFLSSDGVIQLHSVLHYSEKWEHPRVLMILHGMGEHGGRYLHFPHYLQSVVSGVFCLDHRGHGRSEGLRGHVDRFDILVDDVIIAVSRLDAYLKKHFGKSEIHIMGHSMGGLILLRSLMLHPQLPFRSASVSAPVLKIKMPLPAIKRFGARLLSEFWGTLHLISEINPHLLSHDAEVIETYISDRLVHNKGTPRLYTELTKTMESTFRQNLGIQIPLQMMVPMQDEIVDSDATLQFFRALKLRDKLLKTYPGFYHEIFNEIGKEQVFGDLVSWIKTHSIN